MTTSSAVPTTGDNPPTSGDSRANRGIWTLMRPVRSPITLAMAMGALGVLASLGAVATLALVVSALLTPDGHPWLWVCLALVLTLAGIALRIHAFKTSHLAAFELETILRTELSEHLARVPLGYLLRHGAGPLSKIIHEDVRNLHAFVADSTPFIGRNFALPAATVILLVVIDWRLALAAILILALGLTAMMTAMRGSTELQRRYDEERERIAGSVVEFVQAMPVVRTFDDGESSFGRYQSALEGFRTVLATWLTASATSAKIGIVLFGPLPTLTTLAVCGVMLMANGSLALPAWAATLLLGTGLAEAFMPLMWLHHLIRKANGSAVRIQELMAVDRLRVSTAPRIPRDASVRFEDVRFRYEGRDDVALDGVNFHVPAGTVTALVGPSGAGKTTAARLIPRFWDICAGSVRIGDVDVRDLTPETLMHHVAFVFQDTFLFQDSIAANIGLGRPEASRHEIEAAAQAAQAHEFISRLPQGYETLAGERGARLSGGERQRITIARAILQNCPVVVLDEATAFADPENEAALIAALANLMRGRTVIIIAHRLSTIRDADQIVVLDKGRVAEQGRHDDLIAASGVYARLWQSYEQAQGWCMHA